jgi:tetratricopeptide (TPR) repeat protein
MACAAVVLAIGDPTGAPTAPAAPPGLVLSVALVLDPEFPGIDAALVARALDEAAATYAERFAVAPPRFLVNGTFESAEFLAKYAQQDNPRCAVMFNARYTGGGELELLPHQEKATRFLERWTLEALLGFIDEKDRPRIKSHADVYKVYAERYLKTVAALRTLRTPKGTPLVSPDKSIARSMAAWNCALQEEGDFDVVITNAFILADILTDPQPASVFGKGKIGGLATANPKRGALGQQALLASTFAIDTPIASLSELNGHPASVDERAAILGSYLLAHEISHAVFGVPDVFDHPAGCLMTSRPGETYREGLKLLREHPGPCPACRPYVDARAALDDGRSRLFAGDIDGALLSLARAVKITPKQLHGGYKRRIGEISALVAQAYFDQGRQKQALSYAKKALALDPTSIDAQRMVARWSRPVEMVSSERTLPAVETTTTAAQTSTRSESARER